MSVVITAFQVNRDGGGPMSCQYNEVNIKIKNEQKAFTLFLGVGGGEEEGLFFWNWFMNLSGAWVSLQN